MRIWDERDTTIVDIVDEAARRFGGRTAFVEGETRLTFVEVRDLSIRLAKHFLALGIGKGDRVAVMLPNDRWHVLTHLALCRVGAVLTPLNLAYRQQELRYMLAHNQVRMVVLTPDWQGTDLLSVLLDVLPEVGCVEHVLVSRATDDKSAIVVDDLLKRDAAVSDADLAKHRPGADDAFAILFTSGTQSNPKATLHTYRTFVPGHIDQSVEYQFSSEDVFLSLGSFGHMFSIPMISTTLRCGMRHVLLPEYSPQAFLAAARREGVTVATGVPTQWLDILRAARDEGIPLKMRLVITGGSKIPPHMVHQLRDQFGCTVAAQWGMTEVCAGAYTRPGDPPEASWQTVGRVCPRAEVRVLDPAGDQELPVGEIGELAFRGPSLFVEYLGNPQATAAVMTQDGFFRTGDLVYLDEQGFIHFVGRTKDIINRGGLKIYALEIEDLLLEHPKIRQAAVVAMPDERLGERACAFVALTESSAHEGGNVLTLNDVTDYLLAKGVAKYKLPERLEIRKELPSTASGKVQKAKLAAWVRASVG
ncbi:class I adenylate-forming enzyme family protein [Alicyclobacillus kakegawensis]|uniref:class I adenylate-forming enzyme family protein n=1 Tax=Alicyclobacillus kakegawensis TaxID=392012 RepID=UPI00082B2310|nr:class I adenylate-forming enzyme family protein [Alicyclobacillus kakegawensis]